MREGKGKEKAVSDTRKTIIDIENTTNIANIFSFVGPSFEEGVFSRYSYDDSKLTEGPEEKPMTRQDIRALKALKGDTISLYTRDDLEKILYGFESYKNQNLKVENDDNKYGYLVCELSLETTKIPGNFIDNIIQKFQENSPEMKTLIMPIIVNESVICNDLQCMIISFEKKTVHFFDPYRKGPNVKTPIENQIIKYAKKSGYGYSTNKLSYNVEETANGGVAIIHYITKFIEYKILEMRAVNSAEFNLDFDEEALTMIFDSNPGLYEELKRLNSTNDPFLMDVTDKALKIFFHFFQKMHFNLGHPTEMSKEGLVFDDPAYLQQVFSNKNFVYPERTPKNPGEFKRFMSSMKGNISAMALISGDEKDGNLIESALGSVISEIENEAEELLSRKCRIFSYDGLQVSESLENAGIFKKLLDAEAAKTGPVAISEDMFNVEQDLSNQLNYMNFLIRAFEEQKEIHLRDFSRNYDVCLASIDVERVEPDSRSFVETILNQVEKISGKAPRNLIIPVLLKLNNDEKTHNFATTSRWACVIVSNECKKILYFLPRHYVNPDDDRYAKADLKMKAAIGAPELKKKYEIYKSEINFHEGAKDNITTLFQFVVKAAQYSLWEGLKIEGDEYKKNKGFSLDTKKLLLRESYLANLYQKLTDRQKISPYTKTWMEIYLSNMVCDKEFDFRHREMLRLYGTEEETEIGHNLKMLVEGTGKTDLMSVGTEIEEAEKLHILSLVQDFHKLIIRVAETDKVKSDQVKDDEVIQNAARVKMPEKVEDIADFLEKMKITTGIVQNLDFLEEEKSLWDENLELGRLFGDQESQDNSRSDDENEKKSDVSKDNQDKVRPENNELKAKSSVFSFIYWIYEKVRSFAHKAYESVKNFFFGSEKINKTEIVGEATKNTKETTIPIFPQNLPSSSEKRNIRENSEKIQS